MKKIITLSFIMFGSLFVKAQQAPVKDNGRVVIGIEKQYSPAVYDGLFQARLVRNDHQIVLVSGKSFISTYYAIYINDKLVATGKFIANRVGDQQVVNLNQKLEQDANPKYAFSSTPFTAKN